MLAPVGAQRKERRGGKKKKSFDESTAARPPPTLSHSLLRPCPLELIWQRGGSLNQFTQTAFHSFFFFLFFNASPLAFATLAHTSAVIQLSLCTLAFVRWILENNHKSIKMEDSPHLEKNQTFYLRTGLGWQSKDLLESEPCVLAASWRTSSVYLPCSSLCLSSN